MRRLIRRRMFSQAFNGEVKRLFGFLQSDGSAVAQDARKKK